MDGRAVEPSFYLPALPFVLFNGAHGIGTGWSTFIPPYNPLDVAQYTLQRIQGIAPTVQLNPWYCCWCCVVV